MTASRITRRSLIAVVAILMLTAAAACGDTASESETTVTVSRADFGDQWPLTVDGGTLRCEADAVSLEARGVVYAVNGTAESRDIGVDIDPVWADDPDSPADLGLKENIGPLIDRGLALCGD